MHLTLSFVASLIAAASLARAIPTSSSGNDNDFLTIPVTKRHGPASMLVAGSQDVDFSKVSSHVGRIKSKYARTQAAAKANTGSHPVTKRATSNIALTDEQSESFWAGTVQLGGQSVLVDFDTGSSDIVINQGSYTPSSSSTKTSKTFQNSYGTSGNSQTVNGQVYQDTFASGSLKASKANIGLITSGGNIIDGAGGLVGLGYPALSTYGTSYPPLFDVLINNKAVTSPVFGMSLQAGTGSELTLGGLDSTKYSGAITYVPVSAQTYWVVPGKVSGVSVNAIIDSGTTLVLLNTDTGTAQSFFRKLNVQTISQDGVLYGVVSCTAPPTVTFTFGSKTINLNKDAAIFGQTTDGRCVLSIVGASIGMNAAIVGDPLFRSSYIAFDRSRNAVGFATRK